MGKIDEGKIAKIREVLSNADGIVLGAGAGLSASGGINYSNKELVRKWFPEYYDMGFRSLFEIQGEYWRIDESKPEEYWGYWARHIYHIRYEAPVLKPYELLYKLFGHRDYYICTTNVEQQFLKAGFSKEKIFAPQGDYGKFQCIKPCSHQLYDNEEMIKNMISNMPSPVSIRTEDIPKCPKCGGYLVPNLRCDNTFIEEPHMFNLEAYQQYIMESKDKKVVFLELGVGFNTPTIIKYPFQNLTYKFDNATLIRINLGQAIIPKEIEDKSIGIDADITEVLELLS